MGEKQNVKNVVIVGAGIMGTTLGTLLNKLEPDWHIKIFEKMDQPGRESSNEWHNAGTGHEALCELNYTVQNSDGSMDISKAVDINEQFQVSKQFWAHLVQENEMDKPNDFIRGLPHISFVQGDKNADFLKNRFEAMAAHPLFKGMEYTEDTETLAEWMPLIMQNRASDDRIAGTRVHEGTDVNFGSLTRKMVQNLENKQQVYLRYNSDVSDLNPIDNHKWEVKVHNTVDNTLELHEADFVFIGAGGDAIPLLQKTNIPESKQLGGFPISGQFLVCENPEIVDQHRAKVYSKEPEGTPPMTVPHLDRRHIDNKDILLFGPFAGFGPKFLKKGSNMDFFRSIKPNNTLTLLAAGAKNLPLIKYSIDQMMLTKEDRMKHLRTFIPSAKNEDWELIVAGKRVQVITDTDKEKGKIQFGTEIKSSQDLSLAALLGESPGASTSVTIALDILKANFPQQFEKWESHIKQMIPSYGESLGDNPQHLQEIDRSNASLLEL